MSYAYLLSWEGGVNCLQQVIVFLSTSSCVVLMWELFPVFSTSFILSLHSVRLGSKQQWNQHLTAILAMSPLQDLIQNKTPGLPSVFVKSVYGNRFTVPIKQNINVSLLKEIPQVHLGKPNEPRLGCGKVTFEITHVHLIHFFYCKTNAFKFFYYNQCSSLLPCSVQEK